MDSRVSKFLQVASVQQLKDKLSAIGLSSNGVKATLKVRLEEGVLQLNEEQMEEFFQANDEESYSEENNENDEDQQKLEDLRRTVARKEEILAFQKRLAELNKPSDVPSSSCSFRDIEDSLQSFSGDDSFPISKWIKKFEQSKQIYNLEGAKCFIFAQRLLKGTAKLFLRSTSCSSWEELKSALMEEFHHHASASDVHNTLRNRRKRKEENLQQYVLTVLEIANAADIEENDVISYIIRGIPDFSFNKQILFTASSIPELKAVLRKYEKMKLDQSTWKSSFNKTLQQPQPHTTVQSSKKLNIKCYNCNEAGHISSKCPKPSRDRGSCFRCGKQGHVGKDCPKSSVVCILQDAHDANDSLSSICQDFYGILEYHVQTD